MSLYFIFPINPHDSGGKDYDGGSKQAGETCHIYFPNCEKGLFCAKQNNGNGKARDGKCKKRGNIL